MTHPIDRTLGWLAVTFAALTALCLHGTLGAADADPARAPQAALDRRILQDTLHHTRLGHDQPTALWRDRAQRATEADPPRAPTDRVRRPRAEQP